MGSLQHPVTLSEVWEEVFLEETKHRSEGTL